MKRLNLIGIKSHTGHTRCGKLSCCIAETFGMFINNVIWGIFDLTINYQKTTFEPGLSTNGVQKDGYFNGKNNLDGGKNGEIVLRE